MTTAQAKPPGGRGNLLNRLHDWWEGYDSVEADGAGMPANGTALQ